jgi:integrase/recombinase XerD
MTLFDHLTAFLEMLSTERGFSPLSLQAYAKDVRTFIETLPGSTPNHVNQDACLAYLDQVYGQKLSDQTVGRRLSALNQFFGFLVANGDLQDNPLRLVDRPRLRRRLPDPLTREEVLALMEAAKGLAQDLIKAGKSPGVNLPLILELFYATGMRVSELVRLQEGDYLPGKGIMVRGKGGKDRFVPLTPQAHKLLRGYIEARASVPFGRSLWLFPGKSTAKPMTRQQCATLLKKLAGLAGVEGQRVYPHALRHAFATHLLEGGADLMSVQRLLGHADIATTEIYTHVTDQRVRNALEAAHPLFGKKE